MDKELENKLRRILDLLPASGETKYPGMSYEEGVGEVIGFLLGEIPEGEFDYAPKE